MLSSAAWSAADTGVATAVAGQVPDTAACVRQPQAWPGVRSASASASTSGRWSGLWLRCSARGMVAFQTGPSHCCVQSFPDTAAVWISSGTSGKNSRVLPCALVGKPFTDTCRLLPTTCTLLLGSAAKAWGWAARACSKALVLNAVELCSGRLSANSPSSGIHYLRQTSHDALSWMSNALVLDAISGILKSGVMVSGTGSSTVPS